MHTPSVNYINAHKHRLYRKDGKLSSAQIISKQNCVLIDHINNLTSFLPTEASVTERLYCIDKNITSPVLCPLTNQPLKWNNSKQCYNNSYSVGLKTRKIVPYNTKERFQKIEETLLRMFRTKTYKQVDVIEKIKKFNTNVKHWDIEKNYDLFCCVLEQTVFLPADSRWGERFYCINNNITQRVEGINGGYAKYIDSKRGYSLYSTKKKVHEYRLDNVIRYIESNFEILDDLTNISQQEYVTVKCKVCSSVKRQLVICGHWQNITCRVCTGSGRSRAEDEICQYIEGLGLRVQRNTKINGYEVDIFVPDKNIAIEYDGILWHSIGTTYPNNLDCEQSFRRLRVCKREACNRSNIQLITIFENEWQQKQDIVKSIISSKLGVLQERVYARNCTIRQLTKTEKKEFYIRNHIQGNCQSYVDYGLVYQGVLYAAMSFTRRHISCKKGVELARFCCLQNTSVVGGMSKLLTHAVSSIDEPITSYCDLRFSNGNSYIKCGFKLSHVSKPNYFYVTKSGELKTRMQFQKHKLVNYSNYDKNKTESQIMYENGFRKIYDCGNLVFLYSKYSQE
jgi:hypothetical protein